MFHYPLNWSIACNFKMILFFYHGDCTSIIVLSKQYNIDPNEIPPPPTPPNPNSAAFHLGFTVGQRDKLQIIRLLVPCNQMSCYLDDKWLYDLVELQVSR